jgi:16S rRNA (adenine1518-N6/adenine1519-N6)-dimethyltransferase
MLAVPVESEGEKRSGALNRDPSQSIHDSPREIRRILDSLGISPRRRWGQNYLINRGARLKIAGLAEIKPSERIWEIGPGLGAMTDLLVASSGRMILFEIDRHLVNYLKERYAGRPSVTIVPGDVLKTWKRATEDEGRPDKVIGNLPFRSASAILASFIEEGLDHPLIVTVQRELAQRMVSAPRVKDYSSFSVLCQYAYDIRIHGDLNPGSFYPAPRVISTIVTMKPRRERTEPLSRDLFFDLVRSSFRSRRKTLGNNLTMSSLASRFGRSPLLLACRKESIDTRRRPEELDVNDYIRIADRIYQICAAETETETGDDAP